MRLSPNKVVRRWLRVDRKLQDSIWLNSGKHGLLVASGSLGVVTFGLSRICARDPGNRFGYSCLQRVRVAISRTEERHENTYMRPM